MLTDFFGLTATTAVGIVGGLAGVVSIITQVLKNILPSKIPTKLLVFIVSLLVTFLFVLTSYSINVKMIILSSLGSFVVALVSMNGWDTVKEIFERFKYKI